MRILGIFLLLVLGFNTQAQPYRDVSTLIDGKDFPNPVFITPDPPKPIKGWEMTSVSEERVLKGEYPGEITNSDLKEPLLVFWPTPTTTQELLNTVWMDSPGLSLMFIQVSRMQH
nr:hypothetical protein [uncultured Draconibacterium sp.]